MQHAGKSGRDRGLVDMALYPEEQESSAYAPPHGAELAMDWNITLTADPAQSIYVKQWVYRGKTVNFALTHQYREDTEGDWSHVARYDCCHSEVHKHQLHRVNGEIGRTVYCEIPNDKTAWDTVDASFEPCYDDLFDNWQEHHRRWNE